MLTRNKIESRILKINAALMQMHIVNQSLALTVGSLIVEDGREKELYSKLVENLNNSSAALNALRDDIFPELKEQGE